MVGVGPRESVARGWARGGDGGASEEKSSTADACSGGSKRIVRYGGCFPVFGVLCRPTASPNVGDGEVCRRGRVVGKRGWSCHFMVIAVLLNGLAHWESDV